LEYDFRHVCTFSFPALLEDTKKEQDWILGLKSSFTSGLGKNQNLQKKSTSTWQDGAVKEPNQNKTNQKKTKQKQNKKNPESSVIHPFY